MTEIVAVETPSLGDRSYLATDGDVALVIDAPRDFDRIIAVAADRGVKITHVFETHIHNDYVTGGFALAHAAGAQYLVGADDPVSFSRTPVKDGDVIEVGRLTIEVIGAPGHTFTHLAYALHAEAGVLAAFTGGSLLNGSTGRTDLLGATHAEALSRAQYATAHRLVSMLPGSATIYPTHGFGSFCAATPASGQPSTIAGERRVNPSLTSCEDDYVVELLAGLDAYPSYYAHMGPVNLAGPAAPDLTPPRPATPAELRSRIEASEWVVDLRSRTAFATGHLRGTLNFEAGDSMATYVGWLIPWGIPLTLIADTVDAVVQAQRELCRIGIDAIAAAGWRPGHWGEGQRLESFRTADFSALAAHPGNAGIIVLDVRRRLEWESSHIDGAQHIPLHELGSRMPEIPAGEIWVHCQAGYRAAIAASMLAAQGRQVVAIDDQFGAARKAGLAFAAS